jgi:hypothetical protein
MFCFSKYLNPKMAFLKFKMVLFVQKNEKNIAIVENSLFKTVVKIAKN